MLCRITWEDTFRCQNDWYGVSNVGENMFKYKNYHMIFYDIGPFRQTIYNMYRTMKRVSDTPELNNSMLTEIAEHWRQAIRQNKIKHLVFLSDTHNKQTCTKIQIMLTSTFSFKAKLICNALCISVISFRYGSIIR